jgi:hypothetical protein
MSAIEKLEAIVAEAKSRSFVFNEHVAAAFKALAGHVDEVIKPAVAAAAAPLASIEALAAGLRGEVAKLVASAVADAKAAVEKDLAAVFEAWAAKQVDAVAALSSEIGQVKAALTPPAPPANPQPAATPAAADLAPAQPASPQPPAQG